MPLPNLRPRRAAAAASVALLALLAVTPCDVSGWMGKGGGVAGAGQLLRTAKPRNWNTLAETPAPSAPLSLLLPC